MLKSENIICISSIDWDFVWQGHQEIMSAFAKNGNRVLFIENTGIRSPTFKDVPRLRKRIINWLKGAKGFRNETDNIFVYSPLILPFPYSRPVQWINKFLFISPLKRWIKASGFYNPIIWTFLPTKVTLDIVNELNSQLLVYYCIADFEALVSNPKKIRRAEEALLRKCDLVFVQGEFLRKKCNRFNKNVFIFPFGVSTSIFENFKQKPNKKLPKDLEEIRKPIIGYIGGIHRHIDFELIKNVALVYPEYSIVLIGPLQVDTSLIESLSNVFFLGKKQFTDLPAYIQAFDVCIIPYIISEYTKTVYPTKLNEYHIMGKPVVSMALPEVMEFNKKSNDLILIANTHREFIDLINKALIDNTPGYSEARVISAKNNSWDTRIDQMSNLMEDAIKNNSNQLFDWRENFIRMYKVTRRRTMNLVATLLLVWLLIFYTSLFWFLAEPLKISDDLRKVDAIVVFAGGVGESGEAGQGYEERVKYAVELYKEGYADKLIFSSGYTYAFKEPVIMKALAVSLGVDDKAILLEEKASRTYENVKFTRDILYKNKWDKILLVSSPYHMRRVSLLYNKIAKGINVAYAPLRQSLFYNHPIRDKHGKRIWKRINLRQINGIIHEYAGILYYWLKGWI